MHQNHPDTTTMAVDVAPVAAPTAASALPISTLVPVCAVCIAASAAYVSTLLSYYATLAVSLACFARAVWPDRVDGALAAAAAYARRTASRARADLEADLRHLRDAARAHAATARACAGAEACARHARAAFAGWRKKAEAKWSEHRDAACAARFVLRLVALVVRLTATVLFDAARDEARACAPSVLGYLRGVVDGIRSPSSCNNKGDDDEAGEEEEEEEEAGGLVLKDIVCLVGTGFYLLFTLHLLFSSNAASGMQFYAVCFAAMCGLTMLIADWIDSPDDADETDTTATYNDRRPEGDAAGDGETSRDDENEVRESWRFLWVLVLITYCVDAFLLHVTLGPQPTTLAILALCNLEVLKAGRRVQLTPPDDGEGAAEGSAQGVDDGAVNKWRCGAMVVYAASSVKIFVIYLVLDCCLAALGFLWLFVMADLLLAEEDNLSDFDASGEDNQDGEESAGFEVNVTGGAEEEVNEGVREEERSNTNSSSEDEEENSARCDSASEDEKEGSVHSDSSEEHEIVEDGSGGSTDDGWDLVDVDAEIAAKANYRANRKSRLFPWKHAA